MNKWTMEAYLQPFSPETRILVRMPDGSLAEFSGVTYGLRQRWRGRRDFRSAERVMTHANESVIDVCDCCGGDGGFDDTYIDYDHSVRSDWKRCGHCNGEGFVLQPANAADEFWMEEA